MPPSEILFWGLISFIAGIAAASAHVSVYAIGAVIILVWAIISGLTRSSALTKYFAIFLVSAILGSFYVHLHANIVARGERMTQNTEISFTARVSGEPKKFETYQSFTTTLLPPDAGTVVILASPETDIAYGDRIEGRGIISPRTSPVASPVSAFPRIRIVARHEGFWFKEKLLEIKASLIRPLVEFMPANEGALFAGITLGDRSRFGTAFKKDMAASGTTHIVALSGYNIGIVSITAMNALAYVLSRRKSFYVASALIFAFVLMVGAEPSAVRAALMGFLILVAREAGRAHSMKNVIACAAAVMALVHPSVLVYDIGFQLSFASLLGIVYLAPTLEKLMNLKERGIFGWKENAITTFSAQVTVMPILLSAFGKVSIFAILANILILEFVPLTMFFGFMVAAVGLASHYLAFIFAKLITPLLSYEVWVIHFFSNVSFPITVPVTLFTSCLYYAALAALIYFLSDARQRGDKNHGQ